MHLKKLTLEQFRNYASLELNFSPEDPITYIVGENAQGKTNILESVYLLALTKSFRTNKTDDLIGWDHQYARVKGVFENEQTSMELEIFLGRPPHAVKALKKNGVKISTGDFIGTCQLVFFHPEDLNMLYLGPDLRRRYVDILNIQVNKHYFKALRAYKRIMDQRNALLHAIQEGRATKANLEIWDEQLVENGSLIMWERAKTLHFLKQNLQDYYQKISEGDEKIEVVYRHTLKDAQALSVRKIAEEEPALDICENFANDFPALRLFYHKALQRAQNKDIQTRFTSVGPHRDDMEFFLNGLKLSSHASRGEYRSLLLSLKLLELKFFEQTTNQKPLLLLDDVFSELDLHRQQMLLEAIEGHQTIVTTTHLDSLGTGNFSEDLKHNFKNGKRLMIKQGNLI